jgi:hypothetical protein
MAYGVHATLGSAGVNSALHGVTASTSLTLTVGAESREADLEGSDMLSRLRLPLVHVAQPDPVRIATMRRNLSDGALLTGCFAAPSCRRPKASSPAELGQYLDTEIETYRQIVAEYGIKTQ